MEEREVRIYGQVYRIKGDDPDRIDQVAARVDEMMNQLLGGPGQGLSTKGAVLTALNIADQSFEKDRQSSKIIDELLQRTDELLSLLSE